MCNVWQNAWESDSRRPHHPRALDDKELFIIEGSPGAQRPDGRSAKNACKTAKNPTLPQYRETEALPTNPGNCWNLSLQDRRDVNPLSINCSCGTSTVFCTTTHDLHNNGQVNNRVQELDTHVDDLHNRDIDHLVNALHNDGHVDKRRM